MAFLPNITFNGPSGTSPSPYLACLIPGISDELQEKLRNITNSVFLPLHLVMASLSFLSNLLLLVAVARMRTRQHPSIKLLCSLAISDWLWAVVGFSRSLRRATHIHLCPANREEYTYVSILCLYATLSNLAFISKDRYRAIRRPRWYRAHMTRSRALKEALVSWSLSVTIVILAFILTRLLPEKGFLVHIVGVTFYLACLIIIITCYTGIFMANKRHNRFMFQREMQSLAALKREKQLAMTIGFILLVLAITFLPALASPIVLTTMGYRGLDPFRPFFMVLITFNGLINPLINCGRNNAIRRSLRDLIVCRRAARCVPSVAVSS